MKEAQRLRVSAIAVAIVGVLLLTGCGTNSPHRTPRPTATAVQEIEIPDIVGKTISQAEEMLDGVGLSYQTQGPNGIAPHTDWTVTNAYPSSAVVPKTTKVTLVATGPAILVPNLIGQKIADARDALQSLGLSLSTASIYEDDWIIQTQGSAAGTNLTLGSSISVTASEPPQFVTYTVTGARASTIYYAAGGNGLSSIGSVKLPWSMQIPDSQFGIGKPYAVMAQNATAGAITCTITGPSGAVLDTETATGLYLIASCHS